MIAVTPTARRGHWYETTGAARIRLHAGQRHAVDRRHGTWQTPSIAMLQRSATTKVALGGAALPEISAETVAAAPDVARHAAGALGREALPIALLSLVLILGVRGGMAYTRWPLGRARPVDSA